MYSDKLFKAWKKKTKTKKAEDNIIKGERKKSF